VNNIILVLAIWLVHLFLWYYSFRQTFESLRHWPWIAVAIFAGVIVGDMLNDLLTEEQTPGFIKFVMFLPYPAIIIWLYLRRPAKG